MTVHKTVLEREVIDSLNLKDGDKVVDATLGGGGHSIEILKKILPKGKLVAFDQDEHAIKGFKDRLKKEKLEIGKENLELVHSNFSQVSSALESLKIESVDAIIADLGISSDQLKGAERGFSFQKEGPLDMRMDLKNEKTAKQIVNEYSEKELARIIREYGEEKYATKIAKKVSESRREKEINTTGELVDLIGEVVPESYKKNKIHFATRTFQALRIEVNRELENLEKFLASAIRMLKKNGRMSVISFHSGEDRIVKNIFKENARGCICPTDFPVCRCGNSPKIKLITRKPITPTEEEIIENPRSRSAKLRVVEKI